MTRFTVLYRKRGEPKWAPSCWGCAFDGEPLTWDQAENALHDARLSFPYAASYILKVYTGRELAAASLGSAYLHGIAKSPVWGRP